MKHSSHLRTSVLIQNPQLYFACFLGVIPFGATIQDEIIPVVRVSSFPLTPLHLQQSQIYTSPILEDDKVPPPLSKKPYHFKGYPNI